MNNMHANDTDMFDTIAVVGMACRFPGACNIQEFWQNLCEGKENVSFFSDEELLAAGVSPEDIRHPDYVKARAVLSEADMFDAAFFGIPPREAILLDPQHRLFLECAWEALEDAAYNPETYTGRIGVYAGSSLNSYLLAHLTTAEEFRHAISWFQLLINSEKDFLATRTSYKLNLTGPSMTIQTACSTSLVAVHVACQSLLNGECEAAIAGGASLNFPQKVGYRYHEDGIVSRDGHCRAFDAQASGTVNGDGVGILVLKRLSDALEMHDHIYAVIRGSAVNNDGATKVGYTAPSVSGQAKVIMEAQQVAGVSPEDITFIEAHGTATPLGDPIEVSALTQAFRRQTAKKGYCALGSVKTNIGHLDITAGVAGVIKTVLAMQHHILPPSLHFSHPNPALDLENSPFYVPTRALPWQQQNERPLCAGVSSFGIGGTNAHIILEEAPALSSSVPSSSWQLLPLSAMTSTALAQRRSDLAAHLGSRPDLSLADVTYTLQQGRKAFAHRQFMLAQNVEQARELLTTQDLSLAPTGHIHEGTPSLVFLFPGQGSQYISMGAELYKQEAVFRDCVDTCAQILHPLLGEDIREVLYPVAEDEQSAAHRLMQTRLTQPALFVTEYAMAQLWISCGLEPYAMIGHSIGEYVAACLAGVFSLEDALLLVAQRGSLMQQLPAGAMLSVALSEQELLPMLPSELSLAAANTPTRCVVAGPIDAIRDFERCLKEHNIVFRPLHTFHAFHSSQLAPLVQPFMRLVSGVTIHPPQRPYLSNVTGTWITAQDVTDPLYWGQQMRQTVRFADNVRTVLQDSNAFFLEVGPGNTLQTFVSAQLTHHHPTRMVCSSMRHPEQQVSDRYVFLQALGHLWLVGLSIDWTRFFPQEGRLRLSLPTYPFERQRYWPTLSPSSPAPTPALVEDHRVRAATSHDGLEEKVTEILTHLLGQQTGELATTAAFLDLGADSLLLLLFSQALQEEFNVKVSLKQLLNEYTTIELLAAYLAQQLPEKQPAPSLFQSAAPPDDSAWKSQKALPLTDAQKELWFMAQLGEDTLRAYIESASFHLHGTVDIAAIEAAIQALVARHEALRSTFSADGDYQYIADHLVLPISLLDFSDLDEKQCAEQIADWQAREVRQTFDLVRGPLLRFHILKYSEVHHVLVLTYHHIIIDGWSMGVILRELNLLYHSVIEQDTNWLPTPMQYSQYVQWQMQVQDSPEMSDARSYWLAQYATQVEQLALPTDYPRPPLKTYNGSRISLLLAPSLYKQLRATSVKQRCTMLALLLTGYQILLHRLTGQQDIVVGIPAAGQLAAGDPNLVGYCVNLLPVRCQLSPELPAHLCIQQTKTLLLDAYAHQSYPFIQLVKALNIPRSSSQTPLISTLFTLLDAPRGAGLFHTQMNITVNHSGATKFDLSITAIQTSERLVINCDYNTDLFEATTIERWLDYFQHILQQIADQSSTPLRDLSLVQGTELQRILSVNQPLPCYAGISSAESIQAMFDQQATRTPDAIAVVTEGLSLTYDELQARANQLAHYLRLYDVRPEQVVGLCLERSADLLIGMLGVLKAGGAYLPLDPRYPQERLAYMVTDAQVNLFVTQRRVLQGLHLPIRQAVLLDTDWYKIALQPRHAPAQVSTPENLAYVIYTSGSTGHPKGVQVPHRGVINFLLSMQQRPGLFSYDRLVAVTTLSFDIAVLELLDPLTVGAQIIMLSQDQASDGLQLRQALERYAATIMQATPTTWRMLLETGWPGHDTVRILCGGEALPLELGHWLSQRSAATWNMYGPTETTIWSLIEQIHQEDAMISIGRPIAHTQVYILAQNWQLAPVGVVGEIYIGGLGVVRGYSGRPDLTAERFIPDAWGPEKGRRLYRTGDLARYLPDGRIEFLGRKDTQVKFYGHRIELSEIEVTLREHADVQEAVVLLQESGDRQFLMACILPVTGRRVESQELHRFLRQSLPDYMIPATFLALEAFPMTSNGKVDRLALRKTTPAQTIPTQESYVAPRTATEASLAEIWQEVFGLERVSCLDNFFAIGGDSILAVRVSLRAQARGLQLIPQQIFQYQVLEDLAAQVALPPAQSSEAESISSSSATPRFSIDHLSRRERQRIASLLDRQM